MNCSISVKLRHCSVLDRREPLSPGGFGASGPSLSSSPRASSDIASAISMSGSRRASLGLVSNGGRSTPVHAPDHGSAGPDDQLRRLSREASGPVPAGPGEPTGMNLRYPAVNTEVPDIGRAGAGDLLRQPTRMLSSVPVGPSRDVGLAIVNLKGEMP